MDARRLNIYTVRAGRAARHAVRKSKLMRMTIRDYGRMKPFILFLEFLHVRSTFHSEI